MHFFKTEEVIKESENTIEEIDKSQSSKPKSTAFLREDPEISNSVDTIEEQKQSDVENQSGNENSFS
tara:strand:+ start:441 stop:641 length:201 start_codon:yes stop_codon:yes gene_type:complete